MWVVNINCSSEQWRDYAIKFKTMVENYQTTCISSKKIADGSRFMQYKFDHVDDAETFQEECISLGFKATFESF